MCVEISNTENLNPEAILSQCSLGALDYLKNHFTTGQAHHIVKINDATELLPYIQELNMVKGMLEEAFNKYQKMMSSALWQVGCNQDGVFKIDTLVAVLSGVQVAIRNRPQQNNENQANNAGLGN